MSQPFMFNFVYQNKSATARVMNPRVYTDDGVTSATGIVTFTLPAGYLSAIHSAHADVVRNTSDPTQAAFAMIKSATKDQVVVQVFESKTSGILIGGTTEGLEAGITAGLVVYLTVIGI